MDEIINKYLEEKRIVITFNKEMLEAYTQEYFKQYPKRKKLPLEFLGKKRLGQLPSWNRFINSPSRIIQNQWKQELGDYTTFIINKQGLNNLQIDKCIVVAKQFQQTRAKADSDNIHIKAVLDSLVKNGVLVEDNYTVLNPCILGTFHDKENPRTELLIYPIYDVFTHGIVLDIIMKDLKQELESK